MVTVKKLPVLLIKRGVNVEEKNDVKTTATLLRTKQQRKGTTGISRNGQTKQGSRKNKHTNINI